MKAIFHPFKCKLCSAFRHRSKLILPIKESFTKAMSFKKWQENKVNLDDVIKATKYETPSPLIVIIWLKLRALSVNQSRIYIQYIKGSGVNRTAFYGSEGDYIWVK